MTLLVGCLRLRILVGVLSIVYGSLWWTGLLRRLCGLLFVVVMMMRVLLR